jgi:hypothetical protein
MQKRWLKDFEFNINPATWNTAQDLLQAGGVRNLREVERHFWVALVEDGDGTFETEMMITPHKIKAFTCECFTEGRRLMCPHVAASLFKVRQFLEHRAKEKNSRAEARQSTEISRLTVQNALENTTYETLLEFVKEYARRDRDFSLALKTWFAGSVTDTENPYALVLDSLIPKSLQNKQFREPDFRRMRHMLDDLETQYQQAVALHNFRTAYLISSSILQKLLPLFQKTDENRREILVFYSRQALDHLAALQTAPLSPELRESIWELLFDLGIKGRYPKELIREAIRALSDTLSDKARYEKISAQFDQSPFPTPDFTLHLFLATLSRRRLPKAVVKVLDDYIEHPGLIREAILQLYYLQEWGAVTELIEHFMGLKIYSGAQRRELEDILFHIAEKTNDGKRQARILKDRFIQTGHFDFFARFKTVASGNWPAALGELLTELREKNDLKNIAAVLATEGEKLVLANLLETSGDMALLQRYEDLFLPEDKAFVRQRYIELLTEYLREHFGRQASSQVRLQLSGLLNKGQTALVAEIIRELNSRFEDRQSLPEELAELFPKSKRKSFTL